MEAVPLYKSRARELHTTSGFGCQPEQFVKRYETRGTERHWHKSPLSSSFFRWSLGASLFRGFKLTSTMKAKGLSLPGSARFWSLRSALSKGARLYFGLRPVGAASCVSDFEALGG